MKSKSKIKKRIKLPLCLFDTYTVYDQVMKNQPYGNITPSQVADVLDAIVDIERGRKD